MTLEVRNIYPLTPTFKKVASLYEAAFPVEERLPLWQLSRNSLKRGQSFLAYFDQEVFVGLTYAIYTDNLAYLLFLQLRKVKQSQGYGSQILAQIKKEAGVRPCVLTIEPWMRRMLRWNRNAGSVWSSRRHFIIRLMKAF